MLSTPYGRGSRPCLVMVMILATGLVIVFCVGAKAASVAPPGAAASLGSQTSGPCHPSLSFGPRLRSGACCRVLMAPQASS